jgi:hypothetical protein
MNQHWLDSLARTTAGSPSRRTALRQLAGGLVAALAAALIPREAAAHHKPKHPRECNKNKGCPSPEDLCCKGRCTNIVFDRFNCGACGNVCPEGWDCCGQRCVELGTEQNCSVCFHACAPGQVCRDRTCVQA